VIQPYVLAGNTATSYTKLFRSQIDAELKKRGPDWCQEATA